MSGGEWALYAHGELETVPNSLLNAGARCNNRIFYGKFTFAIQLKEVLALALFFSVCHLLFYPWNAVFCVNPPRWLSGHFWVNKSTSCRSVSSLKLSIKDAQPKLKSGLATITFWIGQSTGSNQTFSSRLVMFFIMLMMYKATVSQDFFNPREQEEYMIMRNAKEILVGENDSSLCILSSPCWQTHQLCGFSYREPAKWYQTLPLCVGWALQKCIT